MVRVHQRDKARNVLESKPDPDRRPRIILYNKRTVPEDDILAGGSMRRQLLSVRAGQRLRGIDEDFADLGVQPENQVEVASRLDRAGKPENILRRFINGPKISLQITEDEPSRQAFDRGI